MTCDDSFLPSTSVCNVTCYTSDAAACAASEPYPSATTLLNPYAAAVLNATYKDCYCPSKYRLVEFDAAGARLSYGKRCEACPSSGYTTSTSSYDCSLCNDVNMVYDSSRGCVCKSGYTLIGQSFCATSTELGRIDASLVPTTYTVTYHDLLSSTSGTTTYQSGSSAYTVNSIFGQNNQARASVYCASGSTSACQVLGNLCVLNMYNLNDQSSCAQFNRFLLQSSSTINGFEGWVNNLPFLYYLDDSTSVLQATNLQMQMSFTTTSGNLVQRLQLKFAAYRPTGEYLGLFDYTSQFQICLSYAAGRTSWLNFGTTYTEQCDISLASLFNTYPEMLFLDPYIVDPAGSAGSSTSTPTPTPDPNESATPSPTPTATSSASATAAVGPLFPIPVRVMNYRDKSGSAVNEGSDSSKWFLSRRFFLIDNVSGLNRSKKLQAVRFAQSVSFIVEMQTNAMPRIFPPLLTVKYAEVPYTTLASIQVSQATFGAGYQQSQSSFQYAMMILFACIVSLVGVRAIWNTLYYMRARQNYILDFWVLIAFFYELFAVMGNMFFWMIFAVCAYWFIFFKAQDVVFTLLPTEAQIRNYFFIFTITAFFGKLVRVAEIAWRQTTYDIFFVDWEKPRSKGRSDKDRGPVSMWRSAFVANEWAELQCERVINVEWTLMFLLMMLGACDLINLSTIAHGVSLADGDTSCLLRFAVIAFFWLALALLQALWKFLIMKRYIADISGQFVDLCSVTNISCLLLVGRFHGFYLHGRSVHPFADTTLAEINTQLQHEAENKVASRGLVSEDSCQTFEVYLTNDARENIDRAWNELLSQDPPGQRRSGPAGRVGTAASKKLPQERIVNVLNNELIAFIDKVQSAETTAVVDRSLPQRLFFLPPNLLDIKKTVFYYDRYLEWKVTIFEGVEYDLLLFDILLYVLVDYGTYSTAWAVFVTYMVNLLLCLLRVHLGNRNISRKSGIDDKFLL